MPPTLPSGKIAKSAVWGVAATKPTSFSSSHFESRLAHDTHGRIMVKKLPACYGIRKGRGAPVVVHSWSEVVAKVRKAAICPRAGGPPPPPSLLLVGFRGVMGGAAATASDLNPDLGQRVLVLTCLSSVLACVCSIGCSCVLVKSRLKAVKRPHARNLSLSWPKAQGEGLRLLNPGSS